VTRRSPQHAKRGGPGSALADKNTLVGRASRAVGWSFASNATARLGTVAIGIALARLLGPHQFGTYAVAYVALIAVLSLNELGVSLAIVRWPGDPREITPTIVTISMATSFALYVGCFLGAPAYAAAMGAPQATSVIRVLALNVIIDGLTSAPAALLQRQFRQDKKMIADQINCWLGAVVTIVLAWYGLGAMSLAIGRMTGCLIGGIPLFVFAPEGLRPGFNRTKARALLGFGLPLAGSSLVVFAVTNVDQLVVGRILGPTALGYYVLAFNLSGWPGNMFSQPVRAVAPAAFARVQHDRAAMAKGFLNVAGLLCAVALPVCALLSGSAVPLIGFVYGAHWLPAARALIWLALLAGLRIFFELVYDFFVVLARSRVVLTVQVVWLIALVPALIVGAHAAGIFGAALAGLIVAVGVVLPWYIVELNSVGIRPLALGARLRLPLLGAAAAGLCAMGAKKVAPGDLTACLIAGFATMLIIGLLAYRMRSVLSLIRQTENEVSISGSPSITEIVTSDGTEDYRRPTPEETARAIALLQSLAVHRTENLDVTGPIPIYHDYALPGFLPLQRRQPPNGLPINEQAVQRQASAAGPEDAPTLPGNGPAADPGRHAARGPRQHDAGAQLPRNGSYSLHRELSGRHRAAAELLDRDVMSYPPHATTGRGDGYDPADANHDYYEKLYRSKHAS
jgi:O-antigen/teichoic acid export membrane protein